jgi:branched-subunit amino acid aminotransferase/4-amino-4-deoxychorismate lyase
MIWTRGGLVADDELKVSVLDRTFEHGLGLFETFRTWNGHATLLPRHLDRLARSASELGLPLEPAQCPDESAVRALLRAEGRTGDARLRITLSGGLSASHGSTLWMRASDLPPPNPAGGIRLGKAWPARTDPLAGYKTLNYWPNRLMFEDARAGGFGECVTISPDGLLWEGSMSSLFAVVDGQLLTPPCAGRALPGIMRSLILERGPRLGLDVREAPLGLLDRLFRPEEVFLTNSVRGIMPVGEWGEARFPVPGPVARRLWDDIRSWLESGCRPDC